MIRGLHRWLIRLLVGKTPVIVNARFPNSFAVSEEHLGRLIMYNCWIRNVRPSFFFWETGRRLFDGGWRIDEWEQGRQIVIRRLHRRLIRLIVGKMPVIMNVHFLEGMRLASEHLEEGTLMVNCFEHESVRTEAGVRLGGIKVYINE